MVIWCSAGRRRWSGWAEALPLGAERGVVACAAEALPLEAERGVVACAAEALHRTYDISTFRERNASALQSMITWIIEPFSYAFMRTGALAALFVGLSCATLGVHVILRRMAFIGDALSHTVLPGVVLAYLNGWSLFLGALVSALLTALGIGWISRRNAIREDTAIGVLFTGMFALGILMISTVRSFRDFSHILFGNILGVTPENLLVTAFVTLLVLIVLFLFHKELELTAVDPVYAEVIGLHPDRMRMLLLVLLACTIVTSIQVVGVVLTSALLITPAAAASLLTRHMARMIGIAAGISIMSSLLGLYISYYNGVASGAAIVLACTMFFGLAWLLTTLRRISFEF